MKKFFMSAAALSLLLMSCSNDDSITTAKDMEKNHFGYTAKQQHSLLTVITEVENGCKAITEQGTALINAVESKAFSTPAFIAIADESYTTPTLAELSNLEQSPQLQIMQMGYRTAVKEQLLLIAENKVTESYTGNTLYSKDEQELLETCRIMDDNKSGNGHVRDAGIRTRMAFAYGYQKSKANAVLMTVLANRK